jgi:hypothetical protein
MNTDDEDFHYLAPNPARPGWLTKYIKSHIFPEDYHSLIRYFALNITKMQLDDLLLLRRDFLLEFNEYSTDYFYSLRSFIRLHDAINFTYETEYPKVQQAIDDVLDRAEQVLHKELGIPKELCAIIESYCCTSYKSNNIVVVTLLNPGVDTSIDEPITPVRVTRSSNKRQKLNTMQR